VGLLSSIELPHWLMIGGAILIAIGFLGLALLGTRKPRFQHPPVSRLQREHADRLTKARLATLIEELEEQLR
jgi:hypothetical protein